MTVARTEQAGATLPLRLFLVGFMASGKSTVGSVLAEKLGRPFLDLDAVIEAEAGESIPEIFESRGEPVFRDLEHRCLTDMAAIPSAVIATGGGTMVFERNREAMRRLGVSIWLDPGIDTLLARLRRTAGGDRPLYQDEAQARALYNRRVEAYRMADLRVTSPTEATAHAVADKIQSLLRERSCGI
ncbi:MAG: shikimate kinase [Acidobacteriota bacterium]